MIRFRILESSTPYLNKHRLQDWAKNSRESVCVFIFNILKEPKFDFDKAAIFFLSKCLFSLSFLRLWNSLDELNKYLSDRSLRIIHFFIEIDLSFAITAKLHNTRLSSIIFFSFI